VACLSQGKPFCKIWIDFYSKRRGYILFDTLTKLEIDANVVKILSSYSVKSWIYPSAITRKSGMPIEAVYQLLVELEREGLVERADTNVVAVIVRKE